MTSAAGISATGPPLIETVAEATPEWFTQMFRSEGLDVTVTDVAAAPVGTGQMAENARFQLTYAPSDGSGAAPATVVGKFPATDAASRAAGAHGGYAHEVNFYRSVASTVAIASPHCYFAALADDGVAFTLILEDLAPAVQGDQIAGCSVTQAEAAVVNLAGLHGPRWSDPTLMEIANMSPPGDPDRCAFIAAFVQQLTPGFIDRYRPHLGTPELEVLETFAERVDAWMMRDLPAFGLVHGDYRLDNLLFAPSEEHAPSVRPVVTVDWQTPGIGAPLNDVAYFLGNGLPSEIRAIHEHDLVGVYHRALLDHGVDGVGFTVEDAFHEYRWGSFHGPLITVLGSMMVGQTARGDEMFMVMLKRSVHQIRHLGALDLLAP